jgi:hypothetical protein
MNLNITATLSEEQLKTIVNDWFVRKENMEVESIDFNRSQLNRSSDVSRTKVIVSLRKRKDIVDAYQR